MKKYQVPELNIIIASESDIIATSRYSLNDEDGVGDVRFWNNPNGVIAGE